MLLKNPFCLSAFIAAALFSFSGKVAAQDDGFDIWTGNGFLRNCSGDINAENSFRLGICFGYLDGWLARDAATPEFRFVCRPPSVPNGQVMDVLLKYLRENPETRHNSIDGAIVVALSGAFPCQPKT